MAFFSMHAYDADVWVPEFRGLNQADIQMNPDLRFAAEAENVETPHGVLQPQAAFDVTDGPGDESARVETLAMFHRRWRSEDDLGSDDWYICAAGGLIYQRQAKSGNKWAVIKMPTGVDAFESNLWSWVTYEKTINGATVDVLIMSNAKDGMIMIVPPDSPSSTWGDVKTSYTWEELKELTWAKQSDDDPEGVIEAKWTITPVDTRTDPEDDSEPQKKFAVIERWNERIWGTGVPGEPDTLYYSKAYAPDDWTNDPDIPENSAGEVRQPTWDGDQFFALKRFGDQLLAFKKNRIWRVLGVSPDQFDFHEQYGKGTEYFNTIAVEGERCYIATRDGMEVYDGLNTVNYGKEQIEQIWRTVNADALDQMCAAMHDRRYYLAFPTGGNTVNNAMLMYDLDSGSIILYPYMYIESFLPVGDELYATSSTIPGKIMRINWDSWTLGRASGAATKWVSPWMDFGYKRIQKGGFDFYFLPEVQNEEVTFTITIQTEKKMKTKQFTCLPLTEEQKAIPKQHRGKRLHFGGSGRKFRIILETGSGSTAPWRLVGGIQMVVETDPD